MLLAGLRPAWGGRVSEDTSRSGRGRGPLHLSSVDFLQRGPGVQPLAGFQGCPLRFSLLSLPKGAHRKNLYLKGPGGSRRRCGSLHSYQGDPYFMRLANKVAIITGSAGGMGKAAAELFAREGANIVVTDIAAAEGEETARSIRDAGGRAIFIKANAANEDDVRHMVDAAIAAFGHVDVLYNNAGIMPVEDGSVTDITAATWDRVIDV